MVKARHKDPNPPKALQAGNGPPREAIVFPKELIKAKDMDPLNVLMMMSDAAPRVG